MPRFATLCLFSLSLHLRPVKAVTLTASQGEAVFLAPQKMTFASTDPPAAAAFCERYLLAKWLRHKRRKHPEGDGCTTLEWVTFLHTAIKNRSVPSQFVKFGFDRFHFHFVKHLRRPMGSQSISEFERLIESERANFTRWNAWMDYRTNLHSDSLDDLVLRLTRGGVPFLARLNQAGPTFSIFVAIPHVAAIIEITSMKLTLLRPAEWSQCSEAKPAVWSNAGRSILAQPDGEPSLPPSALWPRRFVFPSSQATDAAAFVARYMKGALHSPPAENCFTARGSLWKGADAPFEMAWVQYHSPLFPAVSAVAAFETYVQRLHGNLSHCSAYNWDHYMDYKAGLLFDNCAGILARLEQDGVPYFLVPHSDFYGVHMQAPGGTIIEAICPSRGHGSPNLKGLTDWQWCREPKASDSGALLHGFYVTKQTPSNVSSDNENAAQSGTFKRGLRAPTTFPTSPSESQALEGTKGGHQSEAPLRGSPSTATRLDELPSGAPADPHTGLGPRCGNVTGFLPIDKYNTRAPMSVAEALSWLAAGKIFAEIGTRKGDIFMCVAHYAARTVVIEADGSYCDGLKYRAATGRDIDVQCPVMFGEQCPGNQHCTKSEAKYSLIDADVYYSWMSPPPIDFGIMKILHDGIKAGKVRETALYTTLSSPIPRSRPINLWTEIDLSSRASRAYNVHWKEDVHISKGSRWGPMEGSGWLSVYRLADSSIFQPGNLTKAKCAHSRKYSPSWCQPPPELKTAFDEFLDAERMRLPSLVPTRNP